MPSETDTSELRLVGAVELDLTAAADKPTRISVLAYGGGTMSPAGFGPLIIDFVGLQLSDHVTLLSDHESRLDSVIGSGVPTVRGGKLFVEGTLADTAAAAKVRALAKAGVRLEASVGVEITERGYLRAGEKANLNGQTHIAPERGLTIVKAGVLREVSVLPLGADRSTTVSVAASAKGKTMSTELANDQQNDLAIEADRIRASSVPGWLPDAPNLVAKGIHEGWDQQRCELENLKAYRCRIELEQLRAERPQSPAIRSGEFGRVVKDDQLLAAAILHHAGKESVAEKEFGAHVTQRARDLRCTSLVDICRASLHLEHRDIPVSKDAMLRAALSTVSLPIALGDAAHKQLLSVYRESPATWRSFAAVRSVDNFKDHHGIRPSLMHELEQLPPGGEIKHGTVGETD